MATENGAPRPARAPQRRIVQAVLCLLALACLAAAGFAAFRTWRAAADESQAQRLGQTSAEQALAYMTAGLRWRPDDADLWRQRANFAAFADPADARRYALRAVALNPQDWRAWQTLGLLDFQLGNLPASRRDLAAATHYDHGFDSHFALGNLALAQGNEREFSKEMAAALAIAPVDRADYALREILSHAHLSPGGLAGLLPSGRADVVAKAIEFFLISGKFAAAAESWQRLHCEPYQYGDCRQAALTLVNAFMAAALASQPYDSSERRDAPETLSGATLVSTAVSAWNEAASKHILRQQAVTTGAVADGTFRHSWVGSAFSWQSSRILPVQLIAGPASQGNAVRLAFTGYQPDAILFQEFVPVKPETRYSLSYKSRRQSQGTETGLELELFVSPEQKVAVLPAALEEHWVANRVAITIPKGRHVLDIAFAYKRPNGQVRLHDPVLIANVEMKQLSR